MANAPRSSLLLLMLALIAPVAAGCSLLISTERDYCKDPLSDLAWYVTDQFCRMQEREIQLINDEGQLIKLRARIADDLTERMAGYQFIGAKIIEKTAILFIFPSEIRGSFHMCNVLAPLDIAWFSEDGLVLDVQLMEPGPVRPAQGCPTLYAPASPEKYLYALEARKDFFKEIKLSACREKDISDCKNRLVLDSLPRALGNGTVFHSAFQDKMLSP